MSVHTVDPKQIQQDLEAAIRESWENWCVDDVQEEREEKQDKKLGPQILPAIFWGLEAYAEKAGCVRDPGMQTDAV